VLAAAGTGTLRRMSDDESTSNVHVVSGEDVGIKLDTDAAEAAVDELSTRLDALRGSDVHVITLRGADGWQLDHPVQCLAPADCPVTEAAGRISRAMCATLGRWQCDVAGGSLMLTERLGDA
jgi:hypothetical protein